MRHLYLLLVIIIAIFYLNNYRENFGSGGGALIQLMANASGNGNYPLMNRRCGNYKLNNKINYNDDEYDITPYDNHKKSI